MPKTIQDNEKELDSLLERYATEIKQLNTNRLKIAYLRGLLAKFKKEEHLEESEIFLNPNVSVLSTRERYFGFDDAHGSKENLAEINPEFEVRDYSLAERLEISRHLVPEDRVYWTANFIFREIKTDGERIPIYCRNSEIDTGCNIHYIYNDTVRSVRFTPDGGWNHLVTERSPAEIYNFIAQICGHYQELGVKDRLIGELRTKLDGIYSEKEIDLAKEVMSGRKAPNKDGELLALPGSEEKKD